MSNVAFRRSLAALSRMAMVLVLVMRSSCAMWQKN